WLDAYHDPMASIHTTPSCLRLVDVTGNGDPKLIVADQNQKLRVYKGINLISELALLDTPSAICPFYAEQKAGGGSERIPSIAVACGQFIFIYKKLRPNFKFALPAPQVSEEELNVWSCKEFMNACKVMIDGQLVSLQENGTNLTYQSSDLLSKETLEDRTLFIEQNQKVQPTHSTTITCMESIKKNSDDETATSCLVVGAEHKQVTILDATNFSILMKVTLPAVPAFIGVTGLMDVEYRLAVAGRGNVVYMIKNGQLMATTIELESSICGLICSGKSIIVADAQNVMYSFHFKGKKNYSIHMPAPIQALETMQVDSVSNNVLQLVALQNGEIRLYREKTLVSSITSNDVVTCMRFGKYAREDSTLLLVYKNGGMAIKILSRNSNLNKTSKTGGPPPEQDIPLNVPKKTKLYIEQTQARKKQQAIDMHRIFQRDLCKLRLNAARSYVKILTDGNQKTSSHSITASLKLNVEVQGLGPYYKLIMTITNTGTKINSDCKVMIRYNPDLYKMQSSFLDLPPLMPGPQYRFEEKVRCAFVMHQEGE
ncbi:hypothetical protein GUITHDRAFT_70223, partial [Guillardia theta CCMP2712]